MTKPKSRQYMFWLFGILYFVQGVIISYQTTFFKPHMDSAGVDPRRIGLVASLALVPFIIKAIFGLISDRVNLFGFGHRIPYMIMGVILCSIAFFVAYFIDPAASFFGLAVMVLSATFAMALFDTTADAYAVDVISEEDHARVQTYMTSGRAGSLIILSFVFGLIAERFGFSSIFLVISVILLLPLIMLFQIGRDEVRPEDQQFSWEAFRACIQPDIMFYSGFLILTWTCFQAIEGLVTFYMSSQLGVAERTLGNYGTLKGIGMVCGAIGMNWLIPRLGRRAIGIITIIGISIGGLLFSTATEANMLLVLGVVWGLIIGFHWTIYGSISMGVVDMRIAGTMFALLQVMPNIGFAVGDGVATALTASMSFSSIFLLFSGLNLAALPLFWVALNGFDQAKKIKKM